MSSGTMFSSNLMIQIIITVSNVIVSCLIIHLYNISSFLDINWKRVFKRLLRKVNNEELKIYSNIELKHDIDQILSMNKLQGKKCSTVCLDRRSAELGYYFSYLELKDIKENENIVLVEVAQATSTGYVYQYSNQKYKLRNRINVANNGKEGEITSDTFIDLIEDFVEIRKANKFVVVYEEKYLECKPEIKKYFKMNQIEYRFIRWSKTDGCKGLLKRGVIKDDFPTFDNEYKSYAPVALPLKRILSNQIKGHDKDKSIEGPSREFHMDTSTAKKSYKIPKAISQYTYGTFIMGIDFGTTKCSAAVPKNNQIEVVQDNDGNRSFKSFISFDQAEPSVGSMAFKKLKGKPEYVVHDIKRIIGKSSVRDVKTENCWSFEVKNSENGVDIVTHTSSGYKAFNPIDLSAILLREMKNKVSELQRPYSNKKSSTEVVITVPSFFNHEEREAIKSAAECAGMEVLDLLDEPVAAILYHIANKKMNRNFSLQENQNILVFNLGGGTLDISILQIKDGKLKELGKSGERYLGGQSFDSVLAEYVQNIMENEYNIKIKNKRYMYKLMSMVEAIKIDLAVAEKST